MAIACSLHLISDGKWKLWDSEQFVLKTSFISSTKFFWIKNAAGETLQAKVSLFNLFCQVVMFLFPH